MLRDPSAEGSIASPQLPASGTVVFLFTAIEGVARLWERQPQAMAVALDRYDALMRPVLAAHHGYVFQTIGDALCVAFTHAEDALAAALAAQRAIRAASWDEPIGEIRVKMALHVGEAEARSEDYFAPHTLNRLSRILTVTHGGQILLSSATRQLLPVQLSAATGLRDLGERRLRDISELEHLYQAVAPDLPNHFPPLDTLDRRPSNLPAQPNLLIGRGKELAEVGSLLRRDDVRLVTLSGPGGTGKTRLALQAASVMLDEFAAGVYFVPLAAVSDPALVTDAIASTLNLREAGGKSLLDTLISALADQQMLLVLDNFEQLIVAAPLISQLLAATTRLKLLITSREPLHLAAEREYAVMPLALPDLKLLPAPDELEEYEAVALFLARARAVKFDFQISPHNAAAVAEICTRLDGLPLAIELAAARVGTLDPPAMLARLSSRLALLVRGMRDLPARQQTLRGAIDWSYSLLTSDEQRLFQRLAGFVGGWTLEAAEQVCNPDGDLDVRHRLTQLMYKSLVRQSISPHSSESPPPAGEGQSVTPPPSEDGQSVTPPPAGEGQSIFPSPILGEGWGGGVRFAMLETIREYALDKLSASGEQEALRSAHARYYLALAESAEPELGGAKQAEWLTRLEQEHDNLRAAIAFGLDYDPVLAVRLAGALGRFWQIHGHLSEGRNILAAALRQGESTDPKYRAKALDGAGVLAFSQSDYVAARHLYEQALYLRRQLADKRGIAASLNNLGNVASEQGEYVAASEFYTESLTFAREMGEHSAIARTLNNLGLIAHLQGDYHNAEMLYKESLDIKKGLENKLGIAQTALSLGLIAIHLGDYEQARQFYEETLSLSKQLENKVGIANALDGLGLVAYCQGNYEVAEQLYTQVQTLSKELGYEICQAYSLLLLGAIARMKGNYFVAQALVKDSLTLFWKLQDHGGIVGALVSLGIAEGFAGNEQIALHGVRLLSSGPALSKFFHWLPVERTEYDRIIQICRTLLEPAIFEQAWREGAAMSMAEAVEYALDIR